ncbi:MAG: leucine-rich repeat domain-containing protein, partial [Bacteroidaceae bacterium]|nr:leucine-rich repeat domain-containing protein [Bacteroidaceae bacterium]
SGCSNLTSIPIPPSVTEIGKGAFKGCSSLTSISIPPSVTVIGDSVFSGCSSLTSISIPKGCEVEENTFLDCPKNIVITRY